MKNDYWVDETVSLDRTSLKYKVRKWFLSNCLVDDLYIRENELIPLLYGNSKNYRNSTVLQCIDWLKGYYCQQVDYCEIRDMLKELIKFYTHI
ncbi:MAG: hypothetical protein [Wendovervirus sonii]|uniref:Uncharacterized protein n=1 Tax=phage Lak_Megaphage_Sonny TaxID=3109229 RepID=A0ABZ0Z3U3_9CAUD|nr:MAG: hypothetical protein [phage Lak_Megaphage_Sonny]